jgi:ATP-grasp domain-containing protein
MINAPNSMLFWYPRIKKLGIRQPKTEIVKLVINGEFMEQTAFYSICDGNFSILEPFWKQIIKKARKIGFPLFMRTDEFSAKHSWKDTCYVEKESDLKPHISRLIEESIMCDVLGLKALVFREYIPMNNLFTAFRGDMPVNPEIRAFILGGDVVCAHWYWDKDAIIQGHKLNKYELPGNWESLMDRSIKSIGDPIKRILLPAMKVGRNFNHYWSVDFCQAANGDWVLIDMAKGKDSWHPDCKIKDEILKLIENKSKYLSKSEVNKQLNKHIHNTPKKHFQKKRFKSNGQRTR